MKSNQVIYKEENPKTIFILVEQKSLFVKLVLALLTVVSFLIPPAVTVVSIQYDIGLNIGIVVSYLLFWGIGIYFIRVLLWNSCGKEVLILEKDELNYYADYKLFRDNKKTLKRIDLKIEIIELIIGKEKKGTLIINNSIETVIKIPSSEVSAIKEKIENI
jgi:hypothetical protein